MSRQAVRNLTKPGDEANLPLALIVSVWPPGIGGVASFARRLTEDPRFQRTVRFIRHSAVKRPSFIYPEDWPALGSRWLVPRKAWSSIRQNVRFVWLVLIHRPDLVQIHYNGPFRGFLFWEACFQLFTSKIVRARTIVRHGDGYHFHTHAASGLRRRCVELFYVDRIDALVLQWPDLAAKYREWAARSGRRIDTVVVPNSVDTDRLAPVAQARRARPEAASPLRVGCVAGPETRVKGAFTILDAVKRLAAEQEAPKFRLDALAVTAEFERAVAETGLGGLVDRRGALTVEELVAWYRSLDVFLFPSLSEGFPNALLEAMAVGLPIIVTAVGAVPSVVTADRDALVVVPGDVTELHDALLRLLTDGSLRESLGRAARARVCERYAASGPWLDDLLRTYRQLSG